MRHLLLAAILSTSLLLSHTAVQAQEKGLDEFEAFRNKLSTNKGPRQQVSARGNGYGASPQTPEELLAMKELEKEEYLHKVAKKFMGSSSGYHKDKEDVIAELEGMIVTDSKITAVTVYSDRAKVTRSTVVEIPAGASTIAVNNVTTLLLPETLRADGTTTGHVTFGAVSYKRVKFTPGISASDVELYGMIQPLSDQLKFIDAEMSALQAKKEFLSKIGQTASDKSKEDFARMELKPQEWGNVAQDIFKSYAEIAKTEVELSLKKREIEKQIQSIKNDIGHSRPVDTNTYALVVPVEADKKASLTLNVSYQVPYATWRPIYDARLATDEKGSLEIIQYGSVTQLTGEDWKEVSLTLSTAQPQRAMSLPELNQIWLNAIDEAAARGGSAMPISIGSSQAEQLSVPPIERGAIGDPLAEWRQKAEARRLSLESETAPPESEETEPLPVGFSAAKIETGGFVSEYKIAGPARVMSENTETKLLVGNFSADSEVQVHIKPQISTDAFLVADMTLKGESPLLPGNVNLFRDDAYIGQTAIPLLAPGKDYDLYFGIDDQVKVSRNTLKDENKEEGMITKDRVIDRLYVTDIQNLHTMPVKIIVKEMMPVSKNEKVIVNLSKENTTLDYVSDAENIKGMMQWKFDLAAKEKKELKLGWRVTWPKDHRLTGL